MDKEANSRQSLDMSELQDVNGGNGGNNKKNMYHCPKCNVDR